jgi:hypothetical protein
MRSPARAERGPRRNAVFINIPYDAAYEDLYLALIAGFCSFDLMPRATVEIAGSERRLERILNLIRSCRYSFHDLSRVDLDPGPPPTPRFNMPFELGLVVAWTTLKRPRHEWFVLESERHRLTKSLSDLGGTDPHIHGGTPRGVLRTLTNCLVRRRRRPTLGELERVYGDVRLAATRIRRDLNADSLFEARPFKELVIAAVRSAENRVARASRGG